MADENVQFYDSWNLSDEDKGFIQSSNYADASAVIKALRDTKAFVGADKNTIIKVPKPAEDGTVDYSEVYKTLGRPDDAAGYGFEETDFSKAVAPKLFELGITKSQADGLAKFMEEYGATSTTTAAEQAAAEREKGIAALQKKWGAEYEVNSQVAAKAVRELAEATGINSDDLDKIEDLIGVEKAATLFFAIGSKEGGVKSLTNYNAGVETPEIAAYKLKELMSDPETGKKLAQRDPKIAGEIKRLTELSMKK
jgi:hypothetical protein